MYRFEKQNTQTPKQNMYKYRTSPSASLIKGDDVTETETGIK